MEEGAAGAMCWTSTGPASKNSPGGRSWAIGPWFHKKGLEFRAFRIEACTAPARAEANVAFSAEEGFGAEHLRFCARIFAVFGQKCKHEACAVLGWIEDCRGVYEWSTLTHNTTVKTMAGRVRFFETPVRPPQVKGARDVEPLLLGEMYLKFEAAFCAKLPDPGQVACVTCMPPAWALEHIHVHAQDDWNLDILMRGSGRCAPLS